MAIARKFGDVMYHCKTISDFNFFLPFNFSPLNSPVLKVVGKNSKVGQNDTS